MYKYLLPLSEAHPPPGSYSPPISKHPTARVFSPISKHPTARVFSANYRHPAALSDYPLLPKIGYPLFSVDRLLRPLCHGPLRSALTQPPRHISDIAPAVLSDTPLSLTLRHGPSHSLSDTGPLVLSQTRPSHSLSDTGPSASLKHAPLILLNTTHSSSQTRPPPSTSPAALSNAPATYGLRRILLPRTLRRRYG